MRPPVRPVELVLVVLLLAGGVWLRVHHLGTPSLWWDEIVQIRTADQPDLETVWHEVRDGVAPGTGNAGAVPGDYLALHAWLRATARPDVTALEAYHRVPAAVFGCAALPALWLLARSIGGPVAGVAALAILATSIPHVLYAVEARSYALYVLMTIVNLAAFVHVARAPGQVRRWVIYAGVNVSYVLSALYGVFPIAVEHAVLAARLLRRGAGGRVRLAAMAASGAVVVGLLALYVTPGAVTTIYPRGAPRPLHPLGAILDTLRFLSGPSALAWWLFALAIPLGLAAAVREGRGPLAATIALSLATVPTIVLIAQAKHYYYHPRHALFLLPMLVLAAALGLATVLRPLAARRPAAAMLGCVAVVLVATGTGVRAFVRDPILFFRQTKTHRDFAALARTVATRVASLAPNERYLLLVERNRPGHLANPVVAYYLEAYGIADRVVLRGFGDPMVTLPALAGLCPDGCRKFVGPGLLVHLDAGDPFDQLPPVRRLLRLPDDPWGMGRLGGVGAVVWEPHAPPAAPPGLSREASDGFAFFEPRR